MLNLSQKKHVNSSSVFIYYINVNLWRCRYVLYQKAKNSYLITYQIIVREEGGNISMSKQVFFGTPAGSWHFKARLNLLSMMENSEYQCVLELLEMVNGHFNKNCNEWVKTYISNIGSSPLFTLWPIWLCYNLV